MKKIVLILATTILATTAWGQSQLLSVKGKTKNGKSINVQYYKGTTQDYIESVEYQLVDELKADTAAKGKKIENLTAQLETVKKDNKELRKENESLKKPDNSQIIADFEKQILEKDIKISEKDSLIESLSEQLKAQQAEIERLQGELIKAEQQTRQHKKQLTLHPFIGGEASVGTVLLTSNKLENPWEKALCLNKQASIYFNTGSLTKSFPIAIEAGVGYRNLPMAAVVNQEVSCEVQPDADGHTYRPDYVFDNYKEKLTLHCVEVPVSICFGQPKQEKKVSLYAKLGVTPSYILYSTFANSAYSLTGYYPQWNVTLEDVEELGFFNNGGDSNGVATPTNKFNLWGNASFGAYFNLYQSLFFNLGAKLDYPILKTGSFNTSNTAIDELPLPNGITKYDDRMLIPNLQAGLVYKIK